MPAARPTKVGGAPLARATTALVSMRSAERLFALPPAQRQRVPHVGLCLGGVSSAAIMATSAEADGQGRGFYFTLAASEARRHMATAPCGPVPSMAPMRYWPGAVISGWRCSSASFGSRRARASRRERMAVTEHAHGQRHGGRRAKAPGGATACRVPGQLARGGVDGGQRFSPRPVALRRRPRLGHRATSSRSQVSRPAWRGSEKAEEYERGCGRRRAGTRDVEAALPSIRMSSSAGPVLARAGIASSPLSASITS